MNKLKKIKDNLALVLIAFSGIILRFIAMVLATPYIYQHDVTGKGGHAYYAYHIFSNWYLPESNFHELSQPPINATLQAICMKIFSPFIKYSKYYYDFIKLYATAKILTFIYSLITLYIIYKILKEFNLSKFATNVAFAIFAFYPGMIVMSTQYSNDAISYMFFYLSLFLSIKWAKNKNLKTIILLALSIGIGMLTKVSVGLIAFITGPMMLTVLLTEKKKSNIIFQLLIFALIVFPLGLSYSIRNLILFKQEIGGVYEISKNSLLDLRRYSYTINDRFLSFPINKLFDKDYGIFHSTFEYNVWIDLIKTSTFDEFNFAKDISFGNIINHFFTFIYILNFIFYIIGFTSIIKILIDIVKNIFTAKIKFQNPVLNFKIMCVLLFILAISAYLFFNIRYPYSCNSNYRYIAYITFALVGAIISAWNINKGNTD